MIPNESANQLPADQQAVMDETLGRRLLHTEAISGLRGLADLAQETLTGATSSITPSGIDSQLRAGAKESLSQNEQLAIDEINVLLAKYGQTPANSVEGLIKLRKMLVRAYEDNTLVPAKVRSKLQLLEREIAVVEESREIFIDRKVAEERNKGKNATLESVRSDWDINGAETMVEVQAIEKHGQIDDAHTAALEKQVKNRQKSGFLHNDSSILDKVVDNDRLGKSIDAHKTTGAILWGKVVRPILRPVIRIGLVIVIVGIFFSYFIEAAEMDMYGPVQPFNELRHLVFDPIWVTFNGWITTAGNPR